MQLYVSRPLTGKIFNFNYKFWVLEENIIIMIFLDYPKKIHFIWIKTESLKNNFKIINYQRRRRTTRFPQIS